MVCSDGRVMTTPYKSKMPHGGTRWYGGAFIVILKGKTYKVARLVAEAFHGPPPFDKAVVMHVDENAANNRASNLAWGSQKENLNAPGFLEYCRGRTGENSTTAKSQRAQRNQ